MSDFFYRGMKFAFKRSVSPVAYCSLTILSGTRNEDKRFGGLSHLTEHMIFKGTEYKSAGIINSYIEKLGGELNAYTTKEEIVIHSTVLKEDLAKAVGLLAELAFCPTFPEKELKKEKIVVLDEINSYKDSPSDQIFDDFEEYLFKGSDLSMPVLGKTKTLKKIDVDTLKEYVSSHFIPENMGFAIVADLEEAEVKKMLLKILQKYIPADEAVKSEISDEAENTVKIVTDEQAVKTEIAVKASPKSTLGKVFVIPEKMPPIPPFTKSVNKRNHQANCIIGAQAYSYYDTRRMALILLVNILGGPAANATLNLLLREKNALVYNVEASYTQYCDTGVVTIYFGCDRVNFDKCLKLVEGELARFREKPLTEHFIGGAKKQLLGQLAISSDNGEAQCLSMGKSLLIFGKVFEMDEIRKKIEEITVQDITAVANDIFAPEKLSRLMYL